MGAQDQIAAANEAYGKAVANQDVGAVLALYALYAPDAIFLPPDAPIAQGHDAIRAVLQGYVDAGAQSLLLETTTLDDQGEIVIDVGRYTLDVQPPGADPITDVGKYLQVFKRQSDGSFRIAYDAFNRDGPAA